MRSCVRVAALGTVLAQGMTACSRDYTGTQTARSEGIASLGPQWTEATALRVDATPLVTLGADSTVFSSVSTAHRYADGRIIVADPNARELILFDSKGMLLRRIARKGQGPGEFTALDRFFIAGGDSIVAGDLRARRLTLFDETGAVLRTEELKRVAGTSSRDSLPLTGVPAIVGRFSDGSYLAQMWRSVKAQKISAMTADTTELVRMHGDSIQPLGEMLLREGWLLMFPNGESLFGDAPFPRAGAVTAGDHSYFLTNGARFEVLEYDLTGNLVRTMSILRDPVPVTERLIADFRKDFEQQNEGLGPVAQKKASDWMTFPKALPAFSDVVRSADNRIWARNYNLNSALSVYEVFDTDGKWLGSVSLPSRSTLLEAGRDWVLIRVAAPSDEPLVQLHRLGRSN